MSHCVIIDFKNNVIIDQSKIKNRVNMSLEIEKDEMLESIRQIPEEYMEEIKEANIIGFDFENEEIILYEDVEWSKAENEPYPEETLCEYNSFMIDGLLDYQDGFIESWEVGAFSETEVNAIADDIINAFFGGKR